VAKEFIVTRQRALVDFNVEFAVEVNIKTAKEGWYSMVPLYKIKITILFHLKYKTMDTIKKGTHLRKKQRFGQMKKQKLWYLYLDNSDLSFLKIRKLKGVFHNRTENNNSNDIQS
jgi:hypothetical protein